MIFNIQRYSTHDGPGIRTVVFMKGCSLACRWCQNPESRSHRRELLYDSRLCLAECELCQHAAPEAIIRVGKAIHLCRESLTEHHLSALDACCPTLALTVCGEEKTAEEILSIVRRDLPFYVRSGGGVTLSGGEPFMTPSLTEQILRQSQNEGIHTAVETCLHVPWHYIEPSLPYVDVFLADLKQVDEARFKAWTNGSAKRVLDNLQRLAAAGKSIIIRVPLIPDFNADEVSVMAIVEVAAELPGVQEIHFLPYHTLGIHKYHLLGLPYLASPIPLDCPELLTFAQDYAENKGLIVTLRG